MDIFNKEHFTEKQRRFLYALDKSSKDDEFSALQAPFIQGDWVIGTDGHHMLRVKKSLIPNPGLLFGELEHPDTESVMPKKLDVDNPLKYSMVKKVLDKIPLTDEITCPSCHGDTTVKFHYNYENVDYTTTGTCPICGGCGTVKLDSPMHDLTFPIKIGKDLFSAKELLWLGRIMSSIELDEIRLRHAGETVLFTHNSDLEIMICSAFYDKGHPKPIVLI